jgi:hypothetical protein
MAYVVKHNPDRCPTHAGALLREDVIPATGKTKAEIPPSRHFTAASLRRFARAQAGLSDGCGLTKASYLAMAPGSG